MEGGSLHPYLEGVACFIQQQQMDIQEGVYKD